MKKFMRTGALLVAGVVMLTACGSDDSAEPAAADSSTSAKSASPTPTPTPTLAVGQEQYTPAELEAALAAILADRDMAGEVIGHTDLAPLLESAPDALAGVVITPKQCDVLAATDVAGVLESANMAMIILSETDTLTIASHPDPSVMEKQVEDNNRLLEECAEFQMEAAGQIITSTVDVLDASSDGETTQAYRTTVTVGDQVTESVQVSSVSGTTNVQVSMTGGLAADAGPAISQAEELINDVLAELKK